MVWTFLFHYPPMSWGMTPVRYGRSLHVMLLWHLETLRSKVIPMQKALLFIWGKESLVSEKWEVCMCTKCKNSHMKLYLKEYVKKLYLLRASFSITKKICTASVEKYNSGTYHTQKLLCSIFYLLLQHTTSIISLMNICTNCTAWLFLDNYLKIPLHKFEQEQY